MRAIVVKKKGEFALVEREKPKAEGNLVVVKVAATTICGSDIAYWKSDLMLDKVLGHEFAGTVEDGGNSDFKAGDAVCGIELNPCGTCPQCLEGKPNICPSQMNEAPGITRDGSYAEYVAVRADMLRHIPKGVSMEEACLAEPISVAYHGVARAKIAKGDRVLIVGGGPIGLYAAACAKIKGAAFVAVLEKDDARIAVLKKANFVDEVFDTKDPEYFAKVKSVAPQRFKIVMDCVGKEETVKMAINFVQNGGSLATLGLQESVQKLPTTKLLLKEINIVPSAFFVPKEFDEVLALMADKKLDLAFTISEVIAFDKAQEAFENLDKDNDKNMKVALSPIL